MTTPQPVDEFDEQDRQIAEQTRLPYTPPYVEYASDPKGFHFHWAQLQVAFALPDPAQFPPLLGALKSQDKAAVRRYVRACRELATYSLLNHGGGLTVSWTPEGETVAVDNPSKESLRGFAVLFRQIHSDQKEPASFKVVRSILSAASASSADDQRDARMVVVKEWSRARSQLLLHSLSDICHSKIREAQGIPPELIGIKRTHSPLELISLFNYGEYIHWGDRRGDHAALFQDEIAASFTEFDFHEILIGLSHFYFGYAKVLEVAFGDI